jgi:hypothetical protein
MLLYPAAKTSAAWIRKKTVFSAAGILIIGAQAASNKTASPQKTVNKVRA